MQGLIFTIVIVILISAVCSGLEAAILSVPLFKVKKEAETGTSSAIILLKIRKNINRPLTTIVILNNISNIGGSMFVGEVAISHFGNIWIGTISAILTFLIIIFGEIIPKTIGENYSLYIALTFAKPIYFLTIILTPFVWVIEKILSKLITKKSNFTVNESEIKSLVKIGHKEGSIKENEYEMIHKVFNLNDISADHIMTPRVALTCLNANSTLADSMHDIIDSQHSRIIAIENNKDNIKGVVLKDELLSALIKGNEKQKISSFIHEPHFVIENIKIDKLLKLFKESRQHLAVVVDELMLKLKYSLDFKLEKNKNICLTLQSRLKNLDPKSVLNRGYSILKNKKTDKIVVSPDLSSGTEINAILKDGELDLIVK